MDDVEAALRALSAVITRRDDGKCGRPNATNAKPCDNDLKIRAACSRHATEEEQRRPGASGAQMQIHSVLAAMTLVFSHTRERMGYHWFSRLDIIGSHGISTHWHMSRPSPRGSTWVPGK
jgi:hypothetical protein